jgi:choline monooxygenase
MKTDNKAKPGILSGNVRTMPASFYRSAQQYELCLERIFARSWQFLGNEESLLYVQLQLTKATKSNIDPGRCVLPITLLEGSLNEPLMLVRQEGSLSCLSNVCTHRGSILVDEPFSPSATMRSMRCRYHGRRFGLDGSCQSAPGFEDAADFPGKQDHLPRAAMNTLGSFIFAGIEPVFTLPKLLGDMPERLAFLPLDEFKFAPELSRDYFIDANWALYVDNYLEGLHVPFVHPSLGVLLDTKSYRTELLELGNLQVGVASKAEDAFELPACLTFIHGVFRSILLCPWLITAPECALSLMSGNPRNSAVMPHQKSIRPNWKTKQLYMLCRRAFNQDSTTVAVIHRHGKPVFISFTD